MLPWNNCFVSSLAPICGIVFHFCISHNDSLHEERWQPQRGDWKPKQSEFGLGHNYMYERTAFYSKDVYHCFERALAALKNAKDRTSF